MMPLLRTRFSDPPLWKNGNDELMFITPLARLLMVPFPNAIDAPDWMSIVPELLSTRERPREEETVPRLRMPPGRTLRAPLEVVPLPAKRVPAPKVPPPQTSAPVMLMSPG